MLAEFDFSCSAKLHDVDARWIWRVYLDGMDSRFYQQRYESSCSEKISIIANIRHLHQHLNQ